MFTLTDVLGTLPLIVTILLAFSLAIRILCLGAMAVLGLRLCQWGRKTIRTSDANHESGRTVAVKRKHNAVTLTIDRAHALLRGEF